MYKRHSSNFYVLCVSGLLYSVNMIHINYIKTNKAKINNVTPIFLSKVHSMLSSNWIQQFESLNCHIFWHIKWAQKCDFPPFMLYYTRFSGADHKLLGLTVWNFGFETKMPYRKYGVNMRPHPLLIKVNANYAK